MVFPEDRVLVGVMPSPDDLEIAREKHWYRIPQKHAPTTGIQAEVVAFYFTKRFAEDLRWGIHYYARRTGHELVKRIDLFPEQPNHPRAHDAYYMLQLGPLKRKDPPIKSLRWRRVTFIQTTWDRFTAAREINDLYSTDKQFVDRAYHRLKQRGIQPDRNVQITEQGKPMHIDILIPCQDGAVLLSSEASRPPHIIQLTGNPIEDDARINEAMQQYGGPIITDAPY